MYNWFAIQNVQNSQQFNRSVCRPVLLKSTADSRPAPPGPWYLNARQMRCIRPVGKAFKQNAQAFIQPLPRYSPINLTYIPSKIHITILKLSSCYLISPFFPFLCKKFPQHPRHRLPRGRLWGCHQAGGTCGHLPIGIEAVRSTGIAASMSKF